MFGNARGVGDLSVVEFLRALWWVTAELLPTMAMEIMPFSRCDEAERLDFV